MNWNSAWLALRARRKRSCLFVQSLAYATLRPGLGRVLDGHLPFASLRSRFPSLSQALVGGMVVLSHACVKEVYFVNPL